MEPYKFTALDRCDGCGAQAYFRVTKDDKDLLFCAHDNNEHADKLVTSGWATEVSPAYAELSKPVSINA